MKVLRLIVFISAVILFSGCFDLDSSLFNNTPLDSYALSTAVIPESLRTQVVLQSQGKKIFGYFVQSNGDAKKYCVLYHHGNRDHLQFYWDRVEYFYRMGFNVFIYDYQGYGMSEGTPTEEGVYADAYAAYQYVRSKGFSDQSIINYGFSLGGTAATHAAANYFTPKVHILEAAFASASVLTQSGTLLDIPGTFFMKGEYNNAEKIKRINAPVLILHGSADTFIDIGKNGDVLYRNANEPKQMVRIPGAGHSNIPNVMGVDAYIQRIKQFSTQ